MENFKIVEKGSLLVNELNHPKFYESFYCSLVECGVNIEFGDFYSRVRRNGIAKVLKSLGVYRTMGSGLYKKTLIHKRLEMEILLHSKNPEIYAKTLVKLCSGGFRDIEKYTISDLSKFYALSDDFYKPKGITQLTYIIYDRGSNLYKIGRSSNIESRMSALEKEFSRPLELIAHIDKDVEKALHEEYKSKRKFGEWFNLSFDDVLDIINKYSAITVKNVK